MKMKIESIIVLHRKGLMDIVTLRTNLPSPMPFVSKEPLDVTFWAQIDTGEQYCETNFPGIPMEVING